MISGLITRSSAFQAGTRKAACIGADRNSDKETLRDVTDVLGLEHAVRHLYSVNRPNILLAAEHLADNAEKISRLTELAEKLEGPGIIYCPTRKWAEELAAELNEKRESGRIIITAEWIQATGF
ncbi:hypothetical protein QNN00_13720 [Bacillus velezensis]|nr:hypothetical protein [Bacillus velezensis]